MNKPPKVRFDPTPNPNAGKFTVGRVLVEGRTGRTFASADEAREHPIAERVFAVSGVASVFMADDFITVIKTPEATWPEMEPRLRAAIREAL